MSESESYFRDIDTGKAKGIVRAEISCTRTKIEKLSKKYRKYTVEQILKASDEIAWDMFTHYAAKCHGKGDFYTLKKACAMIEASSFTNKYKSYMLELVRSSANHKGLTKAEIEFREKYGSKTFGKVMRKFNTLGLSPVIIHESYALKTYENPRTLTLKFSEFID